MEIIHFQAAVEINSLHKQIKLSTNERKEQLKRIEDLKQTICDKKNLQDKTKTELDKSSTLLSSNEKKLFDIEKNLNQAKSHSTDATNQQQADALDKEITNLTKKTEELELLAYESMELIDNYTENINDLSTFIDGATKSLEEITHEVNLEVSKKDNNIKNFSARISNLFETMPQNIGQILAPLFKKHKEKSITTIDSGSCSRCAYAINKSTEEQIEIRYEVEFCPGCRRILIPQKALP